MRSTLSILIVALAIALLGPTNYETAHAAPLAIPLRVGLNTWLGFGTGYIAKEKGFFGDLPVEFVIMEDWGIRQNAFISGQTQIDLSTVDTLAISSSKNMQGKVILITDESSGADGIVSKPEIKTAADLKGKKVAYTRATCSHFLLIEYLKQNGLTMNDISRVEVDDPGRAGEAFMSGSVDAAVTWEPSITQIVNTGKGVRLVTSKTFPHQIIDVAVTSPDMLANRKEDIQKFVNGWLKAIDFLKQNPKEANAIMAKNFKIAEKEIPDMAEGVAFADLAKNKDWLLPPGKSKEEALFNAANQAWSEEKLVTTPREAKDMVTSEFISNAK
jgi:NitT/TauT family transport system substrate-binding protein